MAIQNNYNNYIKRQKQNSTGQFRQKVANSLGGQAVGNNTTKKTNGVLGKQASTLGTGITPTQPTQSSSRSVSSPYTMNEHIFTPTNTQNPLQGNVEPQKAMSSPLTNQIQSTPLTNTPQPTSQPIENTSSTEGTGMMSLSDINNSIGVQNEGQYSNTSSIPMTPEDVAQVNQLANTPYVMSLAQSSRATTKPKTPQEIAQELVEAQKKQLQDSWEQKQKELDLQQQQLQQGYDQSKIDAENAYNKSQDDLNASRYQQQEDLNVSGQRRGIQYSPQQLALENVANINLNKNLAEISTQRNELLNKLAMQMSQDSANILMNRQNSIVEFNNSLANVYNDYNKQIMDWAYNDDQTAKDRAWQEKQTKADQEFQKKMQEAQNKWQSGENKLDRNSKSSRSYGGGGGYSSYGGKSYSAYTPYSSRSAYDNWGNATLNLNDSLDANTALQTGKEYMTDMYNAVSNVGGMEELNNKAGAYRTSYEDIIKELQSYGGNKAIEDELGKAYDTGLKHLYNKSYANSTNTPYLNNGTLITPNKTTNLRTIHENKKYKDLLKSRYYSEYARTEEERKKYAEEEEKYRKLDEDRRYGRSNTNSNTKLSGNKVYDPFTAKSNFMKSTPKPPKKPTPKPTKKDISKASKTIQNSPKRDFIYKPKSTPKKKTDIRDSYAYKAKTGTLPKSTPKKKKSTISNIKKTTSKKTTSKVVNRNKSKLQKSLNNLKKNVKKFFKW